MEAGLGEAGVWVEIHPFFLGSIHGLVLPQCSSTEDTSSSLQMRLVFS